MMNAAMDPLARFRKPMGFRKNGSPIYPIAGGSVDVIEPVLEPPAAVQLTPEILAQAREMLVAEGQVFTPEAVEKVRAQEKDKLYGRIESLEERLTREQADRDAAAKEKADAEAAEKAAREAAERAAREEDMSAKDLIRERETEFQRQLRETEERLRGELEKERQERAQEKALFEKDREFNELREYAQAQAEAHKDEIAPQLLSWITGNSREEIDAAIARAISTTEALTQDMQQVIQSSRASLPGVRPTGGPVDFDPAGATQKLTPQQIADMDMATYAKYRSQLLQATGQQNKGMYG
jgi:hypothetical protein